MFNNGTSANCWIQQNVGQDWISTYREILDVVPAVPGNREDRWHLLRTAGHVFGDLGDAEGVADAAERTRLVADECESEEAALKIRMEAATMVVNFHAKAGPQSKLLDAAREILTELDSCACDPETGDAPALRLFAGLYHNAGGPLYRAKEYGLAATFFRRSIRYGGGNAHTYGWLAACLHATDGDRRETLSLLREAAWRDYKGGNLWSRYKRKLPEFVYVADDPEFAAAGALSM